MNVQMKRLDEILPPDALRTVQALIDAGTKTASEFRKALEPWDTELTDRGVDRGYIAYVLEAMVALLPIERTQRNPTDPEAN